MRAIPELNRKLAAPKTLQSTKIVSGIGYDYAILSTLGDIKTMFGNDTLTTNDISVSAMNGNWNYRQIRVAGTAWQENTLLIFFASNLIQNQQVYINIMLSVS